MLTQALLHCSYLTKVETHDGTNYQLMLHLPKKLSSLSANEKISQLLPKLESGWSPLVGLNWKPKRFHYSLCQKLKDEAQVRFKINKMLLHCLDNLKVY